MRWRPPRPKGTWKDIRPTSANDERALVATALHQIRDAREAVDARRAVADSPPRRARRETAG